jgi:hypothetical protein
MSTRLPIKRARRIIAAGIPFGPQTNPCACDHGQHQHTGKLTTGKCRAADCSCVKYRIDPAWELAYRAYAAGNTSLGHALREYDAQQRAGHNKKNPRQAGEWSLGPSDAGSCRRAIWYRNMPPSDLVRDPVDQREARMGEIIHTEAVRRLQKLFPWREFEQPVSIPGLDRKARFDWYDEITAEVEDLKTAGDWRWDQVNDFGASDDVWKQVFLYGLGLHLEGKPVDTVRVTYLKRCNGHDQTFVRDFDIAEAQAYRNELLAIAQALDIVHAEMETVLAENPDTSYDPGELLPRDRSGPSTDPLCARCPFRSHCWNLEQAEAAGRSGESYTVLGPDPVDEDVVWAIEQNVEAKAQYNDWKKVKDETAALIEGLPPRRYGDVKIDEQWYGGGPNYKQDAEDLRRMLLAGEVPDVEHMPVPKYDKKPSLIARRVAKSVLDKEKRARAKALGEAAKTTAEELTTEVTA